MIKGQIYLIGSLRNPAITELSNYLEANEFNVFSDWMAAGERADDSWQEYETVRGRSYKEALAGPAAVNVFQFDKKHLDASQAAVLVMPAGKSGHMELGYMAGKEKPTFILFDKEPDRWDVMYQLATAVCFSREELIKELHNA